MKKVLFAAGTVAVMSLGGGASAATVDISFKEYEPADISAALLDQAMFDGHIQLAFEDFEGFCSFENRCADGSGNTGFGYDVAGVSETSQPRLQTNVGTFRSLTPTGGTAGVGSAVAPNNAAIVRSFEQGESGSFGRYDADSSTGPDEVTRNFLDSNDNAGIRLNIPGTTGNTFMFDRVSFLLTDVDDVNSIQFALTADDVYGTSPITGNTTFSLVGNIPDRPANGSLFLVTLKFSELVDGVTIDMTSDLADGFGADNFSLTTVPLPAAGWMLLAGIGAIGAVSRRKRKADA